MFHNTLNIWRCSTSFLLFSLASSIQNTTTTHISRFLDDDVNDEREKKKTKKKKKKKKKTPFFLEERRQQRERARAFHQRRETIGNAINAGAHHHL